VSGSRPGPGGVPGSGRGVLAAHTREAGAARRGYAAGLRVDEGLRPGQTTRPERGFIIRAQVVRVGAGREGRVPAPALNTSDELQSSQPIGLRLGALFGFDYQRA
jgi:hypothetical protein